MHEELELVVGRTLADRALEKLDLFAREGRGLVREDRGRRDRLLMHDDGVLVFAHEPTSFTLRRTRYLSVRAGCGFFSLTWVL